MNLFFLILAKDRKHVPEKIAEMTRLGIPYLIVCGENLRHPHVVYQKPSGKYDAINFGAKLIPQGIEIVALNDVDTKLFNIKSALTFFNQSDVSLVFSKVLVKTGPQKSFYVILDLIRKHLPIAASGELMFIRHDVLKRIVPMKPCKAEDSYILFKVLEFKKNIVFCQECYAETERTKKAESEQLYKRKTVCGLYQALNNSDPPVSIKIFYSCLPFVAPFLLILGKKGYYWMKGILLGLQDYLRGDRTGIWQTTYMD